VGVTRVRRSGFRPCTREVGTVLSAVILAAGASRRMSRYPKALLPVEGSTFLERTIECADQPEIGELYVVLGAGAEQIVAAVQPGRARFVLNEGWKSGQLGSLRFGVRHLSERSEGVLFTPVDYPLVRKSTFGALISFWMGNRDRIVLPSYRGRKGHPALIPRRLFGVLLNEELPGGARDIFEKERESVCLVELSDPGVVRDVDTPEDYRRYIGELP
jgi:molybdenum cofactor cytidylyltransferase